MTALAALLVLGTATATWLTVTIPGEVVEGVRLPDEVREHTGAAEVPTSVLAAVAAFVAVLPLTVIGLADRLSGRVAGTAARAVASMAGVATAVLAGMAVVIGPDVEIITLGETVPRVTVGPARALHGIAALIVLALTLLAWRVPRTAARAEPSKYTVEAVRGDSPAPTTDDHEVDEWALLEAADAEDATQRTQDVERRP